MEITVKSKYTVFERTEDGRLTRIRDIQGELRQRGQQWELVTKDDVTPGELEGDPRSLHEFTDETGLVYRIT